MAVCARSGGTQYLPVILRNSESLMLLKQCAQNLLMLSMFSSSGFILFFYLIPHHQRGAEFTSHSHMLYITSMWSALDLIPSALLNPTRSCWCQTLYCLIGRIVDQLDRSDHRRTCQSHRSRRDHSRGDCLSYIRNNQDQSRGRHSDDVLVDLTTCRFVVSHSLTAIETNFFH